MLNRKGKITTPYYFFPFLYQPIPLHLDLRGDGASMAEYQAYLAGGNVSESSEVKT